MRLLQRDVTLGLYLIARIADCDQGLKLFGQQSF